MVQQPALAPVAQTWAIEERPHAMTEIDIASDQGHAERGGTAVARLAISNKQINRLVRTFLWRRVTEKALHGSSFGDIPKEINQAYIGDLHRISEAFAAPLANLLTFVKSRHPACQVLC